MPNRVGRHTGAAAQRVLSQSTFYGKALVTAFGEEMHPGLMFPKIWAYQ